MFVIRSDHAAGDADPLSAGESLALIRSQQEQVRRRVRLDPVLVQLAWAIAWGIGFLASYLAYGDSRIIPAWLGVAVPVALIIGAAVTTFGYSASVNRGLRSRSRSVDIAYGWSWALGFGCLTVVNIAVTRQGLTSHQADSLWAGSSLLLVGLLNLAGGALYRSAVTYALGVWSMLSATLAALVGAPGSYLVLSLAGGGGFLVLAVALRWAPGVRARRGAA